MRLSRCGLGSAITALSLISFAEGLPTSGTHDFSLPQGLVDNDGNLVNLTDIHRRQGTAPKWLRIMPLGASIVRGDKSTPHDGFRKPLRDHLRSLDYQVHMVGSQ